MSYVISTCTACDLPKEFYERYDLRHLGLHYVVNGKSYTDDLGATMTIDQFYQKIKEGADTSTSQVSVGEYLDHFRKLLSEGHDILHTCLSSGISGTVQSAKAAVEMLKPEFPDQKIYIVDSLCASSGFGLFNVILAEKRDAGENIESLYNWAMEHREDVQHWFCSTDLKYYIKGGRISKVKGIIGGIFDICPLMCVNPKGELKIITKVRTKKKVLAALVDKMEQHAFEGNKYSGKCYISHSACLEDAQTVRNLILERFRNVKEVSIFDIGTTIGCHTGTGTIALFFLGDEREDER